jgi:hypothetical protein
MYRLSKITRIAGDSTSRVLLDTARGRFYSLSPTASQICESLIDGATFEMVLMQIQQRYQHEPAEQIATDLSEFLATMARLGLCHVDES